MRPDAATVERLVRVALDEDAPWGDVTSAALIEKDAPLTAHLVAREAGVLCGEDLFAAAMRLTGAVRTEFAFHDGERFAEGAVLATAEGPARAVLQAERVALNFVQRLSGIATLTARYVAETAGTKARIVDTRKTTPGLRVVERYAVRCGGGGNHRFSLSDALLAKDNHLALLTRGGAEGLTEGLRAAFARLPHTVHKEVEVDRLDQIEAVLAAGVDTVMLDNFSMEDMRTGVRQIAGRALVEASGGVRLERIREIAATGVDIISVGALTHSVRALDLGLDVETTAL
ncbi:MAG TPA: carboxylating nicotinate-nucleotide diphosphorylase [Acidobacteriaceae bacterium]|jgi:nicotinate-nucleotide pyrophosphorylase (carboxylating)|nr:carboxylating nicotinate-nucleotide diphosphorylase [Acidobacteriaceae bacterium]